MLPSRLVCLQTPRVAKETLTNAPSAKVTHLRASFCSFSLPFPSFIHGWLPNLPKYQRKHWLMLKVYCDSCKKSTPSTKVTRLHLVSVRSFHLPFPVFVRCWLPYLIITTLHHDYASSICWLSFEVRKFKHDDAIMNDIITELFKLLFLFLS